MGPMERTQSSTSNPRVVAGFLAYARGAGAFAALVSALVLLGWAADIELLKSVVPGSVAMKANTALGLMLLGLALVACLSPTRRAQAASGVLSLLALLLGAATLLQYLGGFDLGIDTPWRPDPAASMQGTVPGRMSELSALSLMLLGSLGLAVCRLRWIAAAQGLALVAIAVALYALSTFGYRIGAGMGPFAPVAIHTALLFLLLALGWLAARPEVGMMRVLSADSFGGALARRALLPSLLIPSVLSYGAQTLQLRGVLSPEATVTLLAVSSGGLVAWIIWSVSALLDRVERQQRETRDLRQDANTDALTQLGNRREFQQVIEGLLRRRRDEDAVFSLLMLDLDRFKTYNDAFGHVAGDQALRITAALLKAALRPGDVAVRYGGEEFAVLLPGIDGRRAVLVAERIRRDFHTADWPHRLITVSIGVAQGRPGESPEALVARADQALYAAKQAGRDRVLAEDAGNLPPQSGE